MLFRFFVLQVKWTSHVMVRRHVRAEANLSDMHGIATIWRSRLLRRRKTICKSSLGQLPATEFDINVKTCSSFSNMWTAPTRSSAACTRILMVSARTHDGRTFALTVLVLVSQSLIQSKHPPRRLQTTKRSVCANVRHALYIPNSITPGHIGDPCAPNVSS